MPAIGIGTHQAQGDAASDSLALAFNEGYRLVDTAAAYLTEPVVREAIKKCDVKREDIFITSKLRNACHGYKNTMEAFELTLENLGTDYLDLYLIHWPNPVQYRTIWQEEEIICNAVNVRQCFWTMEGIQLIHQLVHPPADLLIILK